jgi:hypothetical protein
MHEDVFSVITGFVAINQIIFFVISGVINLLWLSHAAKNAEVLSSKRQAARGEIMASFFVPVLSFYRPYQILTEINSASQPQTSARGQGLVMWWWVCNLAAAILAAVIIVMVALGGTITAPWLYLLTWYTGAVLPMTVSSILFIAIMRHLCRLQFRSDAQIVGQF